MVEESKQWDAEDLIRNIDAELERIEAGMGHQVWASDDQPVSRCVRLLPVTPRFKVKEAPDSFDVKVELPGVPEDLVRVRVDSGGIEVSAHTHDPVCRPYYVNIESRSTLDPDSTRIRHSDSTLEVEVKKVKKKRVNVR